MQSFQCTHEPSHFPTIDATILFAYFCADTVPDRSTYADSHFCAYVSDICTNECPVIAANHVPFLPTFVFPHIFANVHSNDIPIGDSDSNSIIFPNCDPYHKNALHHTNIVSHPNAHHFPYFLPDRRAFHFPQQTSDDFANQRPNNFAFSASYVASDLCP